MIKNYQDFIFERFYPNTFSMHWEDLINIYKDQIVPKIGKIIKFENHIISGILDKSNEAHFHQLRSKMKDYRTEFAETLIDLDKFYGKSFSNLAASASNPEDDFKEMQSLLNRAGYTLEVLKKLFDSDISMLISQNFYSFIRVNNLDDKNGYIDFYLYKLNEILDLSTTVYLGGSGWSDALNEFPNDEYIVKYSYGYHKTLYGQLFLKQLGISNEKFVERAYEYLRKYLNDQVFLPILARDIVPWLELRKKFSNQEMEFDFDKYLTLDDDRFIISYYEMYDDFHNKFGGENFSPEWFKERIMTHMRVIPHLDVQDTGDDLIFQD